MSSVSHGAGGARLGDFTADHRMLVLSGMGAAIGVISAFVAYALIWLIAVITNLSFYHRFINSRDIPPLSDLQFRPLMILIPVAGGLVVGLMAKFGSEKIRGHGIPEALEAILIFRSKIQPKVALLKPVSSAIAIGTGGPFGAEGPIIMTGGAFGSLFAQFFRLTSAERKTLLVAGAAAGMTAIFNTPVAAVVLALELLLFEWRPRSLVPVVVACAVSAVVRAQILGTGALFPVTPHDLPDMPVMIYAVGGGIIAALVATLVTEMVYFSEDLFKRIPIHWMWWPAIGGVIIGLGGMVDPAALGVGYDSVGDLLNGNAVVTTVIVLLVVKAILWSLALGSGTSGGVLAPLLLMGGALGAVMSFIFPSGDVSLWVMIGMAAMIGGTMRAPLMATVFMLELTHDLNPFLVVLIGAMSAYAVTVLIMRRDILTEKLARRGRHIAREYGVDAFQVMRAGEIMDPHPVTVPPTLTVHELSELMTHDPKMEHRQGFPIVDGSGHLVGIITRSDIMRVLHEEGHGEDPVIKVGSSKPIVCYPDEPLAVLASRMLSNNVGRLPVVDPSDNRTLLGYIGRSGLLAARSRLLEEESVRERVLDWRKTTISRKWAYARRHHHRTHRKVPGSVETPKNPDA